MYTEGQNKEAKTYNNLNWKATVTFLKEMYRIPSDICQANFNISSDVRLVIGLISGSS